ncbi:MAG: hypothetical protein ACI9MC_001129 [Kiritimatiellia bacterium]|jgi:hypothetical protein
MRRVIAGLIFAVATAITLYATFWAPQTRTAAPGRSMIEVQPGEHVDFAVSPEMQHVQLVTVVPIETEVSADCPQERTYALDVTWINPRGEIRRQARIWERSRSSRWPTKTVHQRASELLDVDYLATDPRTTSLPVSDVLPGGGTLRITARSEGPIVLMRSYGAGKDRDEVGQPPQPEQARVARRVGISHIDELNHIERTLALQKPWRSLPFSGQERESLRRIRTTIPLLSEREQTVAGSILQPDQALSLLLHGPVTLRISGTNHLDSLRIVRVADEPVDSPPHSLDSQPAPPISLSEATSAIDVELPAGLQSIHIMNPSQHVIGPMLFSLPQGHVSHLAADTPAVQLSEFVPSEPRQHLLTGPDRVRLANWRIGGSITDVPLSWAVRPGTPPFRFTFRAELHNGQDDRPRQAIIEDLDGTGVVLQTRRVQLPSVPAPFERRSEDGGWVAEPVHIEHAPHERTSQVRLRSDEPLRVDAHVHGPRHDGLVDPVKEPHLILRYQRIADKDLHRVEPLNPGPLVDNGQSIAVQANVRIEPRPERESPGTRHFVVLKPHNGKGSDRVWLTPGTGSGDRAWCPVHAGTQATNIAWDGAARRLRSQELFGYLQTASNAHLGATWQVHLDGVAWRGGIVEQRLVPVRGMQERQHQNALLQGPPGSILWLRTRGQGCDAPHRALQHWPMDEGDELTFSIDDTWDGRLLRIGGIATDDVDIDVILVGMTGVHSLTGEGGRYLQRSELVALEATGKMLRRPESSANVLDAISLGLRTNASHITMRVRHRGGPRLWIRPVIESHLAQGWQPVRAARLRGGP